MLGDRHPGAGHHERRGGREVERADPPAARAAGIHQPLGVARPRPAPSPGGARSPRRRPRRPSRPWPEVPSAGRRSAPACASPRMSTPNAAAVALGSRATPSAPSVLDGGRRRRVRRSRAERWVGGSDGRKTYPRSWAFVNWDKDLRSLLGGSADGLDSGPMSRTFLATLHFDGTGFVGWQRQPAGRSVQVEFERVLERLFGRRAVAHAAGRTDAGVHAVGLAVSFSAPASWSAAALRRALNALLPKDCWVESVHPMQPGFHARKSAHLPPLSLRHRYRRRGGIAVPAALRVGARPAARRRPRSAPRPRCSSASTTSAPSPPRVSPSRTTAVGSSRAEWEVRPDGRGVSFHVEADRFLHHMVRMLVGTMVDVGLDRRPLADIETLLERGDNSETSPPAPPQGLYFVAATYPERAVCRRGGGGPCGRASARSASALLLAAGARRPASERDACRSSGAPRARRPQRPQPAQPQAAAPSRDRCLPAHGARHRGRARLGGRRLHQRHARAQDRAPRSPWDFFFVPERSRMVEGYGTGFVVRPNGIIITNQHVVANADRVVVTLPDGTDLPAHGARGRSADRHRGAPGGAAGSADGARRAAAPTS